MSACVCAGARGWAGGCERDWARRGEEAGPEGAIRDVGAGPNFDSDPGEGARAQFAAPDRFGGILGPERAADAPLGEVGQVLGEMHPPSAVVLPEMVERVVGPHAEGEAGGGGRLVVLDVDHGRREKGDASRSNLRGVFCSLTALISGKDPVTTVALLGSVGASGLRRFARDATAKELRVT